MGWADHGGWDGPERQPDGLVIHNEFYPWSHFDVTPNVRVKKIFAEARAAATKEAERHAKKRQTATDAGPEMSRTAPRYLGLNGRGWVWHVWDPRLGGLVDTGLHPGPRGVGFPPEEWEKALADAALRVLDGFRGPPGV